MRMLMRRVMVMLMVMLMLMSGEADGDADERQSVAGTLAPLCSWLFTAALCCSS